jgi:DNA-binding IclR family transcriptional regulator
VTFNDEQRTAEQLDGHHEPDKRTAAARVLALLGAFGRGGGSLTLSEISRHAELSLSTTHRLIQEVLQWGGLEADGARRYRLSSKILDLASNSTQAMRLRDRALPPLVELHGRTGLTVHLGVRDRTSVMYLEALRTHPNYTGENRIGGRLQLHVTATGLVLLAFADEAFREDYLRGPLERYTSETVADPDALRSCLRFVRKNGYAVAHRFVAMGAGSVAAPVMGIDGTVRAAVGVVYPTERCEPDMLTGPVRITAKRISSSLWERSQPDPRTIDFNRRRAGLL